MNDPIPIWQTLPETPNLPNYPNSGYLFINNIKIWYSIFGQGDPVLLLHGGLANSNYWANQVSFLVKKYQVIVVDSRGHGRSTRNEQPISYGLLANDVICLLDTFKINAPVIIGWSDGAIIGLHIAIHYPNRLSKLFAFAANSDPNGVMNPCQNDVFLNYLERTEHEYKNLSETPEQYDEFMFQINNMWSTQPNFTEDQLGSIMVPTWIVDGDHDEVIKRENTEFLAKCIPNAGLLIQPDVSHFSFLQDSEQFNNDVSHFLEKR